MNLNYKTLIPGRRDSGGNQAHLKQITLHQQILQQATGLRL
jgi:hypothetical protein